jgi:hypothetical protein
MFIVFSFRLVYTIRLINSQGYTTLRHKDAQSFFQKTCLPFNL